MQYAHLHEYNPDKYPNNRVPLEMWDFLDKIKQLMSAFFGGDESILGRMFIFFIDNPVLVFMISFALAYGAINLARYSFKVAKM